MFCVLEMEYFLSVCCIIKDEVDLEEWIVYNRLIGVQHFYIYDNESIVPLRIRLGSEYFSKCCTIIDFPGKCKQLEAYRHCINNYKNNTRWMMFIDGDEYVYPKFDGTLIKFIRRMNSEQNCDAIGINWVMFGCNGHDKIPDGLVIENFTARESKFNRHIKSICNPRKIINFGNPHFFRLQDPNKYINANKNIITGPHLNIDTTEIIRINHYFVRSHEHFILRCKRGSCAPKNNSTNENISHGKPVKQIFNDIQDNSMNKYKNAIKKIFSDNNIHRTPIST